MSTDLCVAAAQPHVTDLWSSVRSHAALAEAARADIVMFPELSLTGYHLDAPAVDIADTAQLGPIIEACASAGSIALVGAPVEQDGIRTIAMVSVDASRASVVYQKQNLGGDEALHFTARPGPAVIDVRGWRIGLAICKDTGVQAHTDMLARAGIDLYACGVVHHADELEEQELRARAISSTCGVPVVMAGFAGPTGSGYEVTAGHSAIWSSESTLLARAGRPSAGNPAIARSVAPNGRPARCQRPLSPRRMHSQHEPVCYTTSSVRRIRVPRVTSGGHLQSHRAQQAGHRIRRRAARRSVAVHLSRSGQHPAGPIVP